MFGFRQKLIFGFGGLLMILLIVSALGIIVLRQHRGALDKFLYENWRSVEYGQNMVDDLERLNDLAKPLSGVGGEPTAADLNTAASAANAKDGPLIDFDTNAIAETHNVTLPGEGQIADALMRVWNGQNIDGVQQTTDSYRHGFVILIDPRLTGKARTDAYAALVRFSPEVKNQAQRVIKLNLENMTPVEGHIKEMSDRTSRLMIALASIGAILAVALIAVMSRSILQPVRALTRSAREIEQGNLDLVVQVKSRDELQQLAEAFNSMAAKLREYRRTNRAKLIRTQSTTQNAINSLPDAVAILSPDGRVEMANIAAQRLFALRPTAHVSELHTDWLVELFRRTSGDLKAVEPRGYESVIQVLDEGGGERFFLPHAVPILDEDRQFLGVTVVLADVTHLRRLDEMKSGMLSVVSHELKTPLTSIRMGVHLLLEERLGALTRQQNEILAAVREDSDRLQTIIENLLDMSRIESGKALMELKPHDVQKLIGEAVEMIRPAYQDRGVALLPEVPDDLPQVMADPSRIGYVFSNLLTNALKYTAPGGEVRISAALEDGTIRMSVADNGNGIPKEHQPRIFERFYRVPGQSAGGGAGLGLAIAKDIVEAHGGTIRVESIEGNGSTFSFTLLTAGMITGVPRPTRVLPQTEEIAS